MDKKSRNTIIISIIALAIVLITVTYAYFSARITGIESASTISLTAGRMEIVYTEGNEILSFSNIYPREEAWATKTFTLTGYNTTELSMLYNLGLNVTSNTFPNDYLTYDLTLVSSTNGTPIATKTGYVINGTGKIKFGKGFFTDADGDTHNYELKIYFKDNGLDQNDAQEAVFNAALYVEEAFNAPDGWMSAFDGSLLSAIKQNNPRTEATLSNPGQESSLFTINEIDEAYGVASSNYYYTYSDSIEQLSNGKFKLVDPQTCQYSSCYNNLVGKYLVSHVVGNGSKSTNEVIIAETDTITYVSRTTSNALYYKKANSLEDVESVLSSTPDDYGISYYYRGIITNNYIVFANMCWRIVRIDGAGNTKLVLYNYNPNNVTNPCATSEDGDINAFARYNNAYKSAFNTNNNKNTYVGYMYSNNPDATDLDTAHANDNDSIVLTFLKNWYDQKLRNYNDMLADVIWCNDKSIVTDLQYRLPHSNPSLICPLLGSDGKLSKFTARDSANGNAKLYSDNKEYKIGLLTADEIAFAGGSTVGSGNKPNYLYNNASGSNYWTLSPASTYSNRACGYYVDSDVFFATLTVNTLEAVRPAISLKVETTISGGVGTSSNPFVVQ